jgi:hypothetical protein
LASIEQPRIVVKSLLASPYTLKSKNLIDWLIPDVPDDPSLFLPMADSITDSQQMISALSSLHSMPPADGQENAGQHALHQLHKLIDDPSRRLNNDLQTRESPRRSLMHV